MSATIPNRPRQRVAVCGLFHETHTFLGGFTDREGFTVRVGPDLLGARGDASPLDGVLAAAERFGWDVVPLVDARATPGPTVADDVYERYLERLAAELVRARSDGGIDGVVLVLHGAMVTASERDVEGHLLQRLHQLLGPTAPPIAGVIDLHANVTARMVRYSDALVAYRENPHTDAKEAAERAASLLQRMLVEGRRPEQVLRSLPIVWEPTATGTADEPMASLTARARGMESAVAGVWSASIVAGFAFADTEETGASVLVVGDAEPEELQHVADELAALAWRSRAAGAAAPRPAGDVLDELLARPHAGPVVIAEPSDNIGAGAPGDGTGLLRAVLERPAPPTLLILDDAEAVRACAAAGVGARIVLSIGGKGSPLDPGPVELESECVRLVDGRFVLEDARSHLASMSGIHVDMGPCAVVRHGALTLLLTSRRTPPFDIAQLRVAGLEPADFAWIGVKAAVAHRQAYDRIAAAHRTVDTAGPCSSDLTRFPYVHLRRPVYPLDDLEEIPA